MYLFYLDESGEREYRSPFRFFVLCALGVREAEWKSINTEVLALKRTYFDDVSVEIKSNWLRRPFEKAKRYLDPYGLTEGDLREFTAKVYDVILSHDIVLVASVIDKTAMQEIFAQPEDPNTIAYEIAFERIEQYLQDKNEYGILIFDKITEQAVAKRGHENLLSRQHERFVERGTDYVQVNRIVEGLLFIPSHENNLLQLADLCAYNVYRQFHDHADEWDGKHQFRTHYPWFERLLPKFRCSPSGTYVSWGIKRFP